MGFLNRIFLDKSDEEVMELMSRMTKTLAHHICEDTDPDYGGKIDPDRIYIAGVEAPSHVWHSKLTQSLKFLKLMEQSAEKTNVHIRPQAENITITIAAGRSWPRRCGPRESRRR
jgi:hypothetical protein